MVQEIGSGAAAYINAATGAKAAANVAESRPEVAEARSEARGDIPDSKRAVEVQISLKAKEIAADPRQEKPIDL